MRKIVLMLAISALAASTPALADKPKALVAQPVSGLEAEGQLLADALQHAKNDDEKGTHDLLESVVAAPSFVQLSPELRHWAYYLLGLTAHDLGDSKEGLVYGKKAAAMDEATGADWKLVLTAAYPQDDAAAEADALVVIAHNWPTTLDQYLDRYYVELCQRLLKVHDKARRAALLNALSDANWRPTDHVRDVSILWYWLTSIRLEAGDLAGARAAAEKVTSEQAIVQMLADKRFDPVTSADPERFEPAAAAKRNLDQFRQASTATPNRIEGPFAIAVELMTLERNEEALALLDSTLKKAKPDVGAPNPYTDTNDYIIWVMDTRSRLLKRLGRYDEALLQERQVAQYSEHGALNVSQVLNMGDLLANLGRPTEALDAIKDAEFRGMSPYGRMVLMNVRACAAEQLHDVKTAKDALDYMKAHAADGRGPLRSALLCADDQAGVADLLIHELADPDLRAEAPLDVQNFDGAAGQTVQEKLLQSRFDSVQGRPDVQAAINAVGRIHRYPLNAPLI